MIDLTGRLCLSTIGADCREEALAHGLGLEIAEFCTAANLEQDYAAHLRRARAAMAGLDCFWFHAPFAELCPAAIDPGVRRLTGQRYRQAMDTAAALGIRRVVIHGGFIPMVYFPQWFVEQSVLFWREFLPWVPGDFTLALENVMEPEPSLLTEIVRQVDDPRLGLCLDVGHANTGTFKTPPLAWIDPMAPWLRHVHLHNNGGQWDTHSALGEGTVPMETVLERLLERCPQVTFTIENQTCAPSVRWLSERGYLL